MRTTVNLWLFDQFCRHTLKIILQNCAKHQSTSFKLFSNSLVYLGYVILSRLECWQIRTCTSTIYATATSVFFVFFFSCQCCAVLNYFTFSLTRVIKRDDYSMWIGVLYSHQRRVLKYNSDILGSVVSLNPGTMAPRCITWGFQPGEGCDIVLEDDKEATSPLVVVLLGKWFRAYYCLRARERKFGGK